MITEAQATTPVAAPEDDQWNDFILFLQYEVWLEYEVVLKTLEDEIDANREADRVRDNRAFNLARLRLALIQAQVQAAPDWFVESEGSDEYIMLEAAKETARFFEWIKPYNRSTPNDLIHISSANMEQMKELAREIRALSWQHDPIEIRHARSARKHRAIFRAQTNIFKSGELLAAHTSSAGSAPLRSDLLESRRGVAAALEKILH